MRCSSIVVLGDPGAGLGLSAGGADATAGDAPLGCDVRRRSALRSARRSHRRRPGGAGWLVVTLDGRDITATNVLAPGTSGELGHAGTGTAPDASASPAAAAAATSTNFLVRDLSFTAGRHVVTARTVDGAAVEAIYDVQVPGRPARTGARPAKNIILLVGDGMGIAHRTAARIVSRGQTLGKTNAPLAMDTLGVTGLVMTSALNATITDSAPGMSAYVTGHKANNNQVGVYPDNTADVFDNPRVEYVGELLRRTRGRGFNVGLVTTASVADATPAGNAVHTSFRDEWYGIAARHFDERDHHRRHGADGWRRHLLPAAGRRRHAQGRTRPGPGLRRRRLRRAAQRQRRQGTARRGAAQGHPRPVPSASHGGGLRQGRRRALQRRAGARAQPGPPRPADAGRHDVRGAGVIGGALADAAST